MKNYRRCKQESEREALHPSTLPSPPDPKTSRPKAMPAAPMAPCAEPIAHLGPKPKLGRTLSAPPHLLVLCALTTIHPSYMRPNTNSQWPFPSP